MRRLRVARTSAWQNGYRAGHGDGFAAGWDAALAAAGAPTDCTCNPVGCAEKDGSHCLAVGCRYCLGIRVAIERGSRQAWEVLEARKNGTDL